MKKIFSLLVIFAAIVLLSGCSKDPSAIVTVEYITKDTMEFTIEITNNDDVVSGSGMARLYRNYGEDNQSQAGYKAITRYKDIVTFEGLTPQTEYTLEVKATNDDESCTIFTGNYSTSNEGSEAEPYLIKSADEFMNISSDVEETAYYKLVNDIDFTGYTEFAPQCTTTTTGFKGVIDGNGYSLKNITYSTALNYVGIIGFNLGTIKNLKIDGLNVTSTSSNSKYYAGGLVGYNSGKIESCSITGLTYNLTLTSGSSTEAYYPNVGGLVGFNDQANTSCVLEEGSGYISKSNVDGKITVTSTSGLNIGGFVGNTIDSSLYKFEFDQCYSGIDLVVSSVKYGLAIGGFIGKNRTILSKTTNSYYDGTISISGVSTNSYDMMIGGFIGYTAPSTYSNCYSNAAITLTNESLCNIYVGGFIAKSAPNANDKLQVVNTFAMGSATVTNSALPSSATKKFVVDSIISAGTFGTGAITTDGDKLTIGRVELTKVYSNFTNTFNGVEAANSLAGASKTFTLDQDFVTSLAFDTNVWSFANGKLTFK